MRARWVVFLVVASNLITLAIVFGVRAYDEHYRFDIAKWRANAPGDCNDNYRRQMVEDLSENYLRVGMSPGNVRWLLGPPEYVETFRGNRQWIYDTGVIVSDCLSLVVRFGREGRRVTEWHHPFLDD